MAMPSKAEIRKNLEQQLSEKGLTGAVYRSQVEQYMTFHDRLRDLNRMAVGKDKYGKRTLEIDYLKEARQVLRSMRETLTFLGLKPPEEGGKDSGPPPL